MQRLTIDSAHVIDLPMPVAISGAISGGPFQSGIVEVVIAVAVGDPA